jgi:hypothetical protein
MEERWKGSEKWGEVWGSGGNPGGDAFSPVEGGLTNVRLGRAGMN